MLNSQFTSSQKFHTGVRALTEKKCDPEFWAVHILIDVF